MSVWEFYSNRKRLKGPHGIIAFKSARPYLLFSISLSWTRVNNPSVRKIGRIHRSGRNLLLRRSFLYRARVPRGVLASENNGRSWTCSDITRFPFPFLDTRSLTPSWELRIYTFNYGEGLMSRCSETNRRAGLVLTGDDRRWNSCRRWLSSPAERVPSCNPIPFHPGRHCLQSKTLVIH